MIHSGSRHLGLEVAHYYQEMAYKSLNGNTKADAEKLIKEYKKDGREKEIQSALLALKTPVAHVNRNQQLFTFFCRYSALS